MPKVNRIAVPFLLDEALHLGARGWEIFPVNLKGGKKKPYKSGERSNGCAWGKTTDRDEIIRDFQKWPDAGIGIATGEGSGIFVVEADTIEGHKVDGIAAFKALEVKHGALPETLMAESPTGSQHRYFNHPGIKIKSHGLIPGVDVKGDGGFIVAPPSVRPGKGAYRWLNNNVIANAPAWLLALAADDDQDDPERAAQTLLARTWPQAGQGHHDAALVVGGFLARLGRTPDQVRDGVAAMTAGWEREKELCRTAFDAATKHAGGGHAYGFPALAEKFGQQVAERVSGWLGFNTTDGFPDVTNKGGLRPSVPNTMVAITQLGVDCRHDLFKLRYVVNGQAIESFVGEVSDPALLRLCELVHERFNFYPAAQTMHTAVQTLANHHRFHPVRDYLDGLQWDGKPRIDTWLTTYGGAEDNEYVCAVGALVLTAAVRRVREPGCKFDEILVLESLEQGNNKSSALEVLAVKSEWFSDNLPLGLSAKETIEALSGHWIVEAPELHGMRKSDIDKVKAFASRGTDRARLAYDRAPTAAPRQCVIIGTTNNEKYLRDLSGNRRFWPVAIIRFDLEMLKRDRDQLWAEAAAREASGASIRLPERLWAAAAREQQERVIENPFVSVLDTVLREKSDVVYGKLVEGKPMQGKIAAEDVWAIVGVRVAQRSQDRFELLGDAMKQLGWERTRLRVGDNQRAYHYVRGPQPHRRISVMLVGNGDGTPAVPVAGYDNENLAPEVSLPVPPIGERGEGQG